jgi:acyl-CoA synthetase (AMP-forming)/AMP-acid ligase II
VRLFEMLRRAASQFPDKPAAIFPHDERITFAQLDRDSDRVAAYLVAAGVGPGDRVAILSDNLLPSLVYFWGILKSGASNVDVPTLAAEAAIQGILDEAAPKAVVLDPKQHEKYAGEGGLRLPGMLLGWHDAPGVVRLEDVVAAHPDAAAVDPGVTAHDVAMIVYTSGTTGRPNGVMLTHDNFVSNLVASNELMGLTSDDSILVVVPLYYIHGRMQLLLHAMLAGTVVFSAGFSFPAKVHAELCDSGVTGFSGVPYHFKQLLDRSKIAERPPEALRYVLITGGAMDPDGLRRLASALPSAGIHLAYGQTEAAPRITWIGPDEVLTKTGSVGRALPNVNLQILGPDERPVGPDTVGEVAAGGPNIMRGYVSGDEHALGKIDDEGRLRTGDLGRIAPDGHLYLVGRSSEMIKSAGERIFPQEIEDVLSSHPAVGEVAVIGLPDATLGERLVAYVILVPGAQADGAALKSHCLAGLPFVRVPREFRIVDALPQTGSGKVSRGKLRELALRDSGE